MPSPCSTIFFVASTLSSSMTPRGHDARLAEERAREDEVARGPVEEDQPLAAELARRRSRASCEAVLRVDDEHDLVLVQRAARDRAVWAASRTSPTCTCSRSTCSRISSEWPVRTIRCTCGKRVLEAAEDEREDVRRDRRRSADEELAHMALAQLAHELGVPRRATGPRAGRASGTRGPPAVSRMPRGVRTKSSTPSSRSRFLSRVVSAGCVT